MKKLGSCATFMLFCLTEKFTADFIRFSYGYHFEDFFYRIAKVNCKLGSDFSMKLTYPLDSDLSQAEIIITAVFTFVTFTK